MDDHALFRSGLAALLRDHGLEVVGEAGTAAEALRMAERRRPDVVIMDLGLPDMSGSEATRLVRERHRDVAVLILTASLDEHDVVDALIDGAAGYLLKDAPIEQIVAAVEAALAGDPVIAPQMSRLLVERVRRSARTRRQQDSDRGPELTPREQEILRLMVEGRENAEIAEQLHLSPSTVKNHVSTILRKLGVDNRIQAAVLAVRGGLV